MKLQVLLGITACVALAACSPASNTSAAVASAQPRTAPAPPPSGERMTYVVGCVHCHHQLPKQIMNAPSLMVAQTYSLPEFRTLLRTGVTRDGRDLYALDSAMGFTAREQLAYLKDDEIAAIHRFLHESWNAQRVAVEEAKIPQMPGPPAGAGG